MRSDLVTFQDFNIIQVLLVTGGRHYDRHLGLDSTEILENPSGRGSTWRTLDTARLLRKDHRAVTANNVVFLFGRNCLCVSRYWECEINLNLTFSAFYFRHIALHLYTPVYPLNDMTTGFSTVKQAHNSFSQLTKGGLCSSTF